MANKYHVTLSNGDSYTVTTEEHHDDHGLEAFKKHLFDAITSVTGGLVTAYVLHFTLKKHP